MENIIYVGVVSDQLFKKDYLSFFSFCYETVKNKLEEMEFNDFIISDIEIEPFFKKDIKNLKNEETFFFDVKSTNIDNYEQIINIYSPFNNYNEKEKNKYINKLPCIFIEN